MILRTENTEVEVTSESTMEEIEAVTATMEATTESAVDLASPSDAESASLDGDSLKELQSINNILTFWFLIWLVLNMLSRFKSNFIKSTDRME